MNDIPHNIQNSKQLILVSFPICPFVQRSAILLNAKKQGYERINIDLSNKPHWYLNMVPTGKVPALIINQPKQSVIFESAIINEFIDESYGEPLLPDAPLEKAKQRSWISFSEALIMLQFQLFSAKDAETFLQLSQQFTQELMKLPVNEHAPFFNGHALSLMDAAIAPVFTRLKWLPAVTRELAQLAKTETAVIHLLKWIENLMEHEAVLQSVSSDFDTVFLDFFKQSNSYAMHSLTA